VGEENTGWRQRPAVGTGGYNTTDNPAKMRRHFERLLAHCQEASIDERHSGADPLVRQKLARLATEIEVASVLASRNASLRMRGEMTIAAGESAGIFFGELNQRFARTAVEILGLYGPLLPDNARWVSLRGWFALAFMFTVASTIYGGTKDVHRNVLAHRGLGLPRA
jgi:alkylation response protein AidB-like acyl-CoA dehydrogenase